ncbi:uncharacterized protein DUF2637 [Krasilnikovia cinnamomea]|uniref:Uncharacterized protein DUF2637 n=1 Tax=Krasilnikovia cinnamomea TaxID=349313 RepID=A0A4Q7ZDR3_9ACTN|nr:DUF2637 domain-containing protein [Krasilnikovia cinnamomea]RZU48788.1 uncharacterized protein DUF2637 [Krasilnikovia cinnamomea]
MTPGRLRRLQWAVRATLTLGVAASVTANILHARDNPISQAIAAWPPLALLITVELVSRIPLYRKGLGILRLGATTTIAGIAAWISYWHMAGVVARYGETGTVPYLLPLSVDGLIVVSSVSLVELSTHRRDARPTPAPATVVAVGRAATAPASSGTTTVAAAPTAFASGEPSDAPEHHVTLSAAPDPAANAAAPVDASRAAPGEAGDDIGPRQEADDDLEPGDGDEGDDGADLALDLVPLLPAARAARDELVREGRTVSRDALAARLRRNGNAIRNNRVSELVNALRREQAAGNDARTRVSA